MKTCPSRTSPPASAWAKRTKNETIQPRDFCAALQLTILVMCGCWPPAQASEKPSTPNANLAVAQPVPNIALNSSPLGAAGNGYVIKAVTTGQPGAVGTSYRFTNPDQAVGRLDSHVDVAFHASLNPGAPFSIEFWAKPNSLGFDVAGYCPVSSLSPDYFGANRSGWLFYMNNVGRWEFRTGGEQGYSGVCTSTNAGSNAVAGAWQHICGTFDGTLQRLYVNGGLVQAMTLTPVQTDNFRPNISSPIRIGGSCFKGSSPGSGGIPSGNRGWDGWVDEVAIYPSVLTASQVNAHKDAATTNNAGYSAQILADNPVGYWHLDEQAFATPDSATVTLGAKRGAVGATADGIRQR